MVNFDHAPGTIPNREPFCSGYLQLDLQVDVMEDIRWQNRSIADQNGEGDTS